MPQFSEKSEQRLAECHPELQRLFREVIKYYNCTILCGHRTQAEQEAAFEAGNTKLQWPDGKHNKLPSLAVDVLPDPVDFSQAAYGRNMHFTGFVLATALQLGIKIRCGADWNGDLIFDEKFKDLPHFELHEEAVSLKVP